MNRRSDLSTFFHHYTKALRWAEQFEGRISDEDRAQLKEMCRQFLEDARGLIGDEPGMGLDRAGHDFFLTHVGHGAGHTLSRRSNRFTVTPNQAIGAAT